VTLECGGKRKLEHLFYLVRVRVDCLIILYLDISSLSSSFLFFCRRAFVACICVYLEDGCHRTSCVIEPLLYEKKFVVRC